jgi:hypothetical protein
VDSLVLGSVAEVVRGESGAQAAESGPVAAGWSLLGARCFRRAGILGGRSSARTSCVSICEESLKANYIERSV